MHKIVYCFNGLRKYKTFANGCIQNLNIKEISGGKVLPF